MAVLYAHWTPLWAWSIERWHLILCFKITLWFSFLECFEQRLLCLLSCLSSFAYLNYFHGDLILVWPFGFVWPNQHWFRKLEFIQYSDSYRFRWSHHHMRNLKSIEQNESKLNGSRFKTYFSAKHLSRSTKLANWRNIRMKHGHLWDEIIVFIISFNKWIMDFSRNSNMAKWSFRYL